MKHWICVCANCALDVWLMEIEIKVPSAVFVIDIFFSIVVIKTNKQIAVVVFIVVVAIATATVTVHICHWFFVIEHRGIVRH